MRVPFLQDMVDHAQAEYPREACGLVLASGRRHRLVRARNISPNPRATFDLDPDAWLEVKDGEEVVGVYHSHPIGDVTPSMADLSSCEASGLPWYIVNTLGGVHYMTPSGYTAPYLGRPYVWAVHDCYAIVHDWFNREWDLGLPDFERRHAYKTRGGSMYLDNFEACGFVRMTEDARPQRGDLFLIFTGDTQYPNHAAIYLGNGTILHHVEGRLSSEDVFGGMWRAQASHHLRHRTRIGHG